MDIEISMLMSNLWQIYKTDRHDYTYLNIAGVVVFPYVHDKTEQPNEGLMVVKKKKEVETTQQNGQ